MSSINLPLGATPLNRIRRNEPGQVPGIAQPDSLLIAPPVPLPPVSRGARMLNQALASLGAFGDAITSAAQLDAALERQELIRQAAEERRAFEAERQAEREERTARQAEVADAGRASRFAREALPELIRDIDSGTIARQPGESPAAFAARLADERSQGETDAYRAALRDAITVPVQSRAIDADERMVAQARDNAAQDIRDALANVTNESDASGILARSRDALGDISDDDFARMVVLPTLENAGRAGQSATVEAIIGSLDGRYVNEARAARAMVGAAEASNRNAAANQYVDGVQERIRQGQPFSLVKDSIDQGVANGLIPSGRAIELTNTARTQARNQGETDLFNMILRGTLDVPTLDRTLRERALLPVDDPNHTPPEKIPEMIRRAEELARVKPNTDRVATALATGIGVISGEDAPLIEEVLGPGGALATMDASGVILDGDRLGLAIRNGGVLPSGIARGIEANLRSTNPLHVAQAGRAITNIARSDRLFTALDGYLDDRAMASAIAVQDAMARGVTNPESLAIASQAAAARVSDRSKIEAGPEVAALLKRNAVDLEATSREVLKQVQQATPFSVGTWIPFDRATLMGQTSVALDAESFFRDGIEKYTRMGLSDQQVIESATRYARGEVLRTVDLVTFNGQSIPVRIDGNGFAPPLPDKLRWSGVAEKELIADLASLGVTIDRVVGLVPFTTPLTVPGEDPQERMGWAIMVTTPAGFVTELTDAQGRPVIFRPSQESQTQTVDLQRQIDERASRHSDSTRKERLEQRAIWRGR